MESNLNDPAFSNSISKKELLQLTREKEKLHLNLGGIKDLNGKPDLIVIFDVIKDKLAVLEAKKLNIPFHSLSGNITELNLAIENNNIDILVLSTNQIMPKSTLDLPNLIAINVHLAKLPEYGGLFNQFWLMLNDESKSFASVHKASKNLDAGIVLLEDSVDVIKGESLMSLYLRTAEVGGELLHSFLSDPKTYLKVNLEQEKVPHIRGLPTKQDMKKFKSKSLKLIKLKDFFTVEIF